MTEKEFSEEERCDHRWVQENRKIICCKCSIDKESYVLGLKEGFKAGQESENRPRCGEHGSLLTFCIYDMLQIKEQARQDAKKEFTKALEEVDVEHEVAIPIMIEFSNPEANKNITGIIAHRSVELFKEALENKIEKEKN